MQSFISLNMYYSEELPFNVFAKPIQQLNVG